jgi:hypothetical protein
MCRVQDLQSLFARHERITDPNSEIIELEGVVEVVGETVKQIHAFSLATILSLALRTSMIDPSLKVYLPEAVSKLSRYYSATLELVYTARYSACYLFESIKVALFLL